MLFRNEERFVTYNDKKWERKLRRRFNSKNGQTSKALGHLGGAAAGQQQPPTNKTNVVEKKKEPDIFPFLLPFLVI